jgi:hypothetical protein
MLSVTHDIDVNDRMTVDSERQGMQNEEVVAPTILPFAYRN